jgi:DNA-binding protein H-NS
MTPEATFSIGECKVGSNVRRKRKTRVRRVVPGAYAGLSAFVLYRDPDTGNTWCGFGRPPNWIRGVNRERFRVPKAKDR